MAVGPDGTQNLRQQDRASSALFADTRDGRAAANHHTGYSSIVPSVLRCVSMPRSWRWETSGCPGCSLSWDEGEPSFHSSSPPPPGFPRELLPDTHICGYCSSLPFATTLQWAISPRLPNTGRFVPGLLRDALLSAAATLWGETVFGLWRTGDLYAPF